MKKAALCGLAVVAIIAAQAGATTITQWDFNSVPPDTSTTTGTMVPVIGAGTTAYVGGTAAPSSGEFATGSVNDLAADDSAWNTSAYPAQGTGNKTAGAQFTVSTTGYQDIVVSWDQRHSNTASMYFRAQYTTDGANWTDADLFQAAAPDTWYTRSIDLSSVAAADNNPSFAVRIVAEFEPATSAYKATRTSTPTTYNVTGTSRFDLVTISGTVIPEPATLVVLALGSLLIIRRR